MRVHLRDWHQCELWRNCGKDWAIAGYLESPLEIHYSRQPCRTDAAMSARDGDVEFDLTGEHYSGHAINDRIWNINKLFVLAS